MAFMASVETRVERKDWKERQQALFNDRDFVMRQVAPFASGISDELNPINWKVEVIRAKATDRLTLRYTFGAGIEIYGKSYFDPVDGSNAYDCLRQLRQRGFATGSGFEVPEPLGFIAEVNLLLMGRAKGIPLAQLAATGPLEKALDGVRSAAGWLARFHATEMPGLPIESPCERIEILKLADALTKIAAKCPEQSSLLIEMLHALRSVAPGANSCPGLVPLHGQFRAAHVFVAAEGVTVIDLEKICLSDPGKDVARFTHTLKKTCFEEGGEPGIAVELAREFVEEYGRLAPANLENLAYFRALYALKAFAKLLRSGKVDEVERKRICSLHRAEFERMTQGSAVASVAA
jgi:hypothetical protein